MNSISDLGEERAGRLIPHIPIVPFIKVQIPHERLRHQGKFLLFLKKKTLTGLVVVSNYESSIF
jgi:hypothetical protein